MVAAKPIPIKSRREIGTLARRRAIKRLIEDAEAAAQTTPLIMQAMEKLDGFTFPTMGPQLMMAGPKYTMSREFHVANKQFVTKAIIALNKKGGE